MDNFVIGQGENKGNYPKKNKKKSFIMDARSENGRLIPPPKEQFARVTRAIGGRVTDLIGNAKNRLDSLKYGQPGGDLGEMPDPGQLAQQWERLQAQCELNPSGHSKTTEYSLAALQQEIPHLAEISWSPTLLKYAQFHQLDAQQINTILDAVKASPTTVKNLAEKGVPLDFILRAVEFKSARPHYTEYSLLTHAQRLEHYYKMLDVAQQRGVEIGFQLRSKEENNAEGIGVKAFSPDGAGGELQRGHDFISVERNGVQGYGDIVWVSHPDILLRKDGVRFWSLGRVSSFNGGGELSIYTRKGLLLRVRNLIDDCLLKLKSATSSSTVTELQQVQLLYTVLKNPDSIETQGLLSELPVPSGPELQSMKAEILQLIGSEPVQGIDFFNPTVVCLVPQEKYDELVKAIQQSSLPDQVKAVLQSQLVPYEGNLIKAFDNFRIDKNNYIRAVEKNCRSAGIDLSTEKIEELLDVHQALSNTSIVENGTNLFSLSEIPLPVTALDNLSVEEAMALYDRLKETDQWYFLNNVAEEELGIIYPILQRVVFDSTIAVRQNPHRTKRIDTIADHKMLQKVLRKLGEDLTRQFDSLAPNRQVYLCQLLQLDGTQIQGNRSLWESWVRHIFPFSSDRILKKSLHEQEIMADETPLTIKNPVTELVAQLKAIDGKIETAKRLSMSPEAERLMALLELDLASHVFASFPSDHFRLPVYIIVPSQRGAYVRVIGGTQQRPSEIQVIDDQTYLDPQRRGVAGFYEGSKFGLDPGDDPTVYLNLGSLIQAELPAADLGLEGQEYVVATIVLPNSFYHQELLQSSFDISDKALLTKLQMAGIAHELEHTTQPKSHQSDEKQLRPMGRELAGKATELLMEVFEQNGFEEFPLSLKHILDVTAERGQLTLIHLKELAAEMSQGLILQLLLTEGEQELYDTKVATQETDALQTRLLHAFEYKKEHGFMVRQDAWTKSDLPSPGQTVTKAIGARNERFGSIFFAREAARVIREKKLLPTQYINLILSLRQVIATIDQFIQTTPLSQANSVW